HVRVRLATPYPLCSSHIFFFLVPAPTGIYTLSLHDALPIFCGDQHAWMRFIVVAEPESQFKQWLEHQASPAANAANESSQAGKKDRKSTRLNSSHVASSYAVFRLEIKNSTEGHCNERHFRFG